MKFKKIILSGIINGPYTSIHSITLYYSALHCTVELQCITLHCRVTCAIVLILTCKVRGAAEAQDHFTIQCILNSVQCTVYTVHSTQCSAVKYITMQWSTIPCSTVQYSTVQSSAVQLQVESAGSARPWELIFRICPKHLEETEQCSQQDSGLHIVVQYILYCSGCSAQYSPFQSIVHFIVQCSALYSAVWSRMQL